VTSTTHHPILNILKKTAPWIITATALYLTFKDLDWSLLTLHAGDANVFFLTGAVLLTILSYFMRGRRWQSLFPKCEMNYGNATAVLILGFFFNNILPARAGEFVRAHLGAKVSRQSRTLVLATIASERLIDGLTISILFVIFALRMGESNLAHNLFYVALGFAGISIAVLITIFFRSKLQSLVESLQAKGGSKKLLLVLSKAHVFLEGLTPLCSLRRAPVIYGWSAIIWFNELCVFFLATKTYGADLTVAQAVFMMVAVNFSSLIPAAPGGIGVVEAVGTAALVSMGVPKELALIMILTQHVIQYLVVGLPGAFLTLTWKKRLEKI
jgi:uncharacterized protein (TIRG00374 family)